MSDERRLPFNTTISAESRDLLNLVRADYESVGAFLDEILLAWATARLEKGSKLSGTELEISQIRARIAKKDFELRRLQSTRTLDEARLAELEERRLGERDELESLRAQTSSLIKTPHDLVEAHWTLLPPPGPGRTAQLRDLAEAYGMSAREVMRAAGERWMHEQTRQSTLRVLPTRKGGSS